jgi:hypothetical protein
MSDENPSIDLPAPRLLRSALFVDFDNVYSGLSRVDGAAASSFANNPALLLRWLRDGRDEDGAFRRRFLVRDCYLNPQVYDWCRPQFVAAGFRVIDCPSLTQQGKSSADTHIVLDVVDALAHATRYDEFVICSADADFSPLMTKLRRHDRRTTMVAAGPFATAYEAVCDTAIGPMQLVDAFVGSGSEVPRAPLDTGDLGGLPDNLTASAAAAVRAAVAESPRPLPGATAAAAAQRAVPGIAAADWGGHGGFAAFVRRELPELRLVRNDSGGWIVDPARQSLATIPTDDVSADDVIARVCRVTRAPRLSSEQYAALFDALVDVGRQQPLLGRIGADVRDRTAARVPSIPVARGAVNFVVQGLVYAGADPRSGRFTARELAERWRDNLVQLAEQAGIQLSAADVTVISERILRDVPETR